MEFGKNEAALTRWVRFKCIKSLLSEVQCGTRWEMACLLILPPLLLPGRAWVKRLIIILPIKRTIFHFRRSCTPKRLIRFRKRNYENPPEASELSKTLSTSINAARKSVIDCARNINANSNDLRLVNVSHNYNLLHWEKKPSNSNRHLVEQLQRNTYGI